MIFDLSAVTDALTDLVTTNWTTSPLWGELHPGVVPPPVDFTPTISGLAPDEVRGGDGAQLSIYLFHVEQDNAREAQFWMAANQGQAGPPVQYQPLPLVLYYLLSAFSEKNSTQEQQAMSIAMRLLHTTPTVRGGPPANRWEVTLTRHQQSSDELGRLWQATTVGMRLGVVYRAAVVFLAPDASAPPAPKPTEAVLVAEPVAPPAEPGEPVLFGTERRVEYAPPAATARHFEQTPAVAAAGQRLLVLGSDLGTPASDRLFLLLGDGTEVDVSAWVDSAHSTSSRLVVQLPAGVGVPPAGTPPAGVYRLRVGHGVAATPGSFRTGATPFSVAAFVDPAGGPTVPGPPFVVAGLGFAAGATEVALGTIALAPVAGAPGPGEFQVDPAGTTITFVAPTGIAPGAYPVRVRVHEVESDRVQWVVIP